MLLGRQVTWVTSVNLWRPSLLLPGALALLSTICVLNLRPSLSVVGGPQHSSGLDWNGGISS